MSVGHVLAGLPPAPCDTCPAYFLCAEERLACRRYRHYINTGAIREDIPRIPVEACFNPTDGEKGD